MLGSWSDHARIGRASVNDTSTVFGKFFLDLGVQFAWQAQYSLKLQGDSLL